MPAKKDVVTDKEAALRQILGRWPLKYRIRTINNGFTNRLDSTIYNPVDTLIFTDDGKFVKRNKTVISAGNYSVDEGGQNITFSGTPILTQKLSYIRVTTIGLLVSDVTIDAGGTKNRTVVVDQLSKF